MCAQQQARRAQWLKRQAVQVVIQLPEDCDEALRVLGYARELVAGFLAAAPQHRRPRGPLGIVR